MMSRKMQMLVPLLFLAILLFVGCAGEETLTSSPSPTITSTSMPDLSEITRITVDEVKAKLDAGANIVIVDARSTREYEGSHIAGAISIPLGEIAQSYSDLRRYDEIITYCT